MYVFLYENENGINIANFDNVEDSERCRNDHDFRELTEEEKALFVDGLEYAGGRNTTISGDALMTATIDYAPLSSDYFWECVITERDGRLSASDWSQVDDCPKKGNQEWVKYRQDLRDITEQADPKNITWPTEPTDKSKGSKK